MPAASAQPLVLQNPDAGRPILITAAFFDAATADAAAARHLAELAAAAGNSGVPEDGQPSKAASSVDAEACPAAAQAAAELSALGSVSLSAARTACQRIFRLPKSHAPLFPALIPAGGSLKLGRLFFAPPAAGDFSGVLYIVVREPLFQGRVARLSTSFTFFYRAHAQIPLLPPFPPPFVLLGVAEQPDAAARRAPSRRWRSRLAAARGGTAGGGGKAGGGGAWGAT